MAVLKCENCGKMISDKGDDCPYCKTLIHKPNHKQNEVLDPLVLMKKQMFGLIGAALLVVGVFSPIVSLPIVGSMTYFNNGNGDGIVVLVFAAISAILVWAKNFKALWFTGIASLCVMAFTFINFQTKMSEMKADMAAQLKGNPFKGFADAAMQSVQLQWGWALLIIGVALVIASAALKNKAQNHPELS